MADYKQIITEALQKVITERGYQGAIRNRNIHEQALAHRLAFHLENSGYFQGFNIDCEYNRHGDEPKGFRPDILIHLRGTDDNNLIMIETKKFNDPKNELIEAKQNLEEIHREYHYRHAFLVVFPEQGLLTDSVVEINNHA